LGTKTIKTLIEPVKKHPWVASVVCAIAVYGLLGFFLAPYLLEKNLILSFLDNPISNSADNGCMAE
jgi:hypothetical protein